MKITEDMLKRAMAIQGLRSDRQITDNDYRYMRLSLEAALGSDAFVNAPELFQTIVDSTVIHKSAWDTK